MNETPYKTQSERSTNLTVISPRFWVFESHVDGVLYLFLCKFTCVFVAFVRGLYV